MKKKYRMPGVIAIALAASFISIQGVGNAIEGNASPTLYTTYFYNANSVNPGRGAFNIFGNGEAGRPTLNTDIDGGRNIPDMTGETETTTAKRSFEYIPNETSTTEGIWETSKSETAWEPTKEAPTSESTTKEEPTKEEPTKELPTKEEPTKELPTKEVPTKEEPTSESTTGEEPTSEAPTKEEPTLPPPTIPETQPETSKSEVATDSNGKKDRGCINRHSKTSGVRPRTSGVSANEKLPPFEETKEDTKADETAENTDKAVKESVATNGYPKGSKRAKKSVSSYNKVESAENITKEDEIKGNGGSELSNNEVNTSENESEYLPEEKESVRAESTEVDVDVNLSQNDNSEVNNKFNRYDGVTLLAAGAYAGWVAIVLMPMVEAVRWINKKRREKSHGKQDTT